MTLFTLAGLAAVIAGCLCIYWASENQRWLAAPWPRGPARAGGAVLLLLGWLFLARDAQFVAATFTFITALMLVFSLLPYIGAYLHERRTR